MLNNETLITASGVIKNRSMPRVGVINAYSLYCELIDDCFNKGIDLTWETYRLDVMADLKRENPGLDEVELDELFEEESSCVDFDTRVFLLGAWIKNHDGDYVIDMTGKSGSYALEYNTGSDIVCVLWSQATTKCNNTSPCYVMADGSGPCGDLDSAGDAVIAYSLPAEMLRERE